MDDKTTETTYLIGFSQNVKDANQALFTKLGEYIRNASVMCEDDYSLGREVMKIYNGFAMAMNKEIHGDIR